ncbi:DoxX family protein [Nocardia albiluteola]|uniref:DoxX family protein n=1 Tax=Nocardia albiluteola TaxID=2842303 RepID=UPI001FDA60FB|nr:DoxX family protein [Nocardia albiluteola]
MTTTTAEENRPGAQESADGGGGVGVRVDTDGPEAGWNPLTRIAFRFCFVYFGLFCLTISQITLMGAGWFLGSLSPRSGMWMQRLFEPALGWVGRVVFGVGARAYFSGSGDQAIFWVQLCCLLVIALVATAVWTLLDRRRTSYRRLAGWFLLVVRLLLAGQMLSYGFAKLIPTQMPRPALTTLLTPYGDLTPIGVLWNQVGSSPPYEMLLGAAEMAAGVLLFIPRTALLGAMLALVDMAQVFVLNMTFDVPVKILSFHLMLLSLLLLAPEVRRLASVLLGRAAGPSRAPYPFRGVRARRIAALVQVIIGVWVGAGLVHVGLRGYQEIGPDHIKPPLYGIWTVSEFTRDGQVVPPLVTDQTRWRRMVFEYPGVVAYQRMDDTIEYVRATVAPGSRRIVLATIAERPEPLGALTFSQPAPDRAALTGEVGGHAVTIALQRFDADAFPVRHGGFHWVQNAPQER